MDSILDKCSALLLLLLLVLIFLFQIKINGQTQNSLFAKQNVSPN